ncbi:MAG: tetratricopeptide repeat protein [Vitreimonas sp.]
MTLTLRPGSAEAHTNRGNALQSLERYDEAVASFDAALALRPDYAEALNNRGSALQALHRIDEALASYTAALECNPNYVEAYANRASVLQFFRRFGEALADSDRAVALAPANTNAHVSRAHALHSLKRYDEAIATYDDAIALAPDRAATHNDRGNTLRALKRLDEAVASYEAALKLDPDFEFLLGTYLHTKMELCAWDALAENRAKLAVSITDGKKATPPFNTFGLFDDPHLQRMAAQIWTNSKYPSVQTPHQYKLSSSERLRIGYYSADFHDHATTYLMAEMLEGHDRRRFELYGFSFGPDANGGMRARVSSAFEQFLDVRGRSDVEVAALSRDLGIDIAIDLKGFTDESRPGLFAQRCAPIQASFLGYPGTMGADYIDYLIADKVLISSHNRSAFSEKIIYLPGSYQPNDSKRKIEDRAFTREELGLPATAFVFCGLHANYKIFPETFDSWMRILKAVPDSVLWLLDSNATATRNLRDQAEARGATSARLVFAKHMPLGDHLARLRSADLFLDTLPCCAHTTASDALWAGLPVLTRAGESFAGRVAASLLDALELPELIAGSQEDYENKATALATNQQALQTLKSKLHRNRETSSLFKGAVFARNLEAAFEAMNARYQAGLGPADIEVETRP